MRAWLGRPRSSLFHNLSRFSLGFLWAAAAIGVGASASLAAQTDTVLAAIEVELRSGRIDSDAALQLKLLRVFDREQLPSPWRELASRPIRCASGIVAEALGRREVSSQNTQALIELHLAEPLALRLEKASTYLSSAGRFEISYEISGAHAVPLTDSSPANGIPDFVERVGDYFEQSWTRQFEELGFESPDLSGGPYQISFQAMAAYGYMIQTSTAAETRIVLHNDFDGFPPNDDPEGASLGAAKVTAAHELKHASQYRTSTWSEGGWLELDATWMEDVVFDEVNDYYNYLPGGSPISAPATSLDAGGAGSYEDCVFQHWMQETWDAQLLRELWQRRASHSAEAMTASYDWVLQSRGSSMLEGFLDFSLWNLMTGSRAREDFGYGEAARYPTAPLRPALTVGSSQTESIGRMAAHLVPLSGIEGPEGELVITIVRDAASPIQASAVVTRMDGGLAVEGLSLTAGSSTDTLETAIEDLASVILVLSNGATTGSARSYTVSVQKVVRIPQPVLACDSSPLVLNVPRGASDSRTLTIANHGEPGSILHYRVIATAPLPATVSIAPNIAGSTLRSNSNEYQPGVTTSFELIVENLSTDFEWLQEIVVQTPAGVSVEAASDFVGGSEGDLVYSGTLGDGAEMVWTDLNGSWGNIRGSEQATASVSLSFAPDLDGDIVLPFTILGDGYGSAPHEQSGEIVLHGPAPPQLELLAPTPGSWVEIGTAFELRWTPASGTPVHIELSRDGGSSWETLRTDEPDDGLWTWSVEGPATADARLRLSSSDGSSQVSSAEPFAIYEPLAWFQVLPLEGELADGDSVLLQLEIDTSALEVGDWPGQLVLLHDGPDTPTLIPVELQVTGSTTSGEGLPQPHLLLGNHPNPFNPTTTIRFQLGHADEVVVEVLDLRGRIVQSLLRGPLGPGMHGVGWNGTDARGKRSASGIYHVRVSTAGWTATHPVVLLK